MTRPLKTIVVAFDDTDPARRALERAADLAEAFGAKLVVTSVAPLLVGVGRTAGPLDAAARDGRLPVRAAARRAAVSGRTSARRLQLRAQRRADRRSDVPARTARSGQASCPWRRAPRASTRRSAQP